ncbi:2-(3-amino-3-carboxypropyl)histidine synthase subunit 2-like [Acropora millepora]|uniref:2-(3-amino-3-carboxypropyl)histidine synthase subunit 2-like n=1 Tax=Acropora millepora TaxID=45264 RepID=UPI001CF472E8|nr:2-(3-amino-3-carboxypropyl)histidine synthase subunit 2-like [Acropora millepora]
MADAVKFSSGEKEVIERKVEVSSDSKSNKRDRFEFYEISRCVDVINRRDFQKIALQFPDMLLVDSAAVASMLERDTGKKVFVLADTSYGSCCVDEVAAEHVEANLIIHYGRACLSQTRRLPVLYVFGKWPFDVQSCMERFQQMFPDPEVKVLVFCDVMYSHCMDELETSIQCLCLYSNVIFTKLTHSAFEDYAKDTTSDKAQKNCDDETTEDNNQDLSQNSETGYYCKFGREFRLPENTELEEWSMFYIGSQSLCLTNLMMSYNKCQFYSYDPCTNIGRQETLNVNKALMKRYYMIQRAKDAQVVGIVVGTLGVADYLQIIERLKKMIKLAGKKSYLFVMGKLNVAKMANFMEVDAFVLVACPENSLIDSKEFFKPIVTPFEMELACLRTREWTGDYITDFRELLPGASASVELEEDANDCNEVPDVSLITGHLRPAFRSPSDTAEPLSSSLVERNEETTLSTQNRITSAEFLASRSWKGLEQNLGETPVTKAVEGKEGIAAGYTDERGLEKNS